MSTGTGGILAVVPPLLASTRVVLIEDDDGDALIVREMLDEVEPDVELVWVRTIAEATPLLSPSTGCVLLDLQLPDAQGFSGLDAVLAAAPRAAVIVLTGFTDTERGVDAVARGAQDYLGKGQLEPALLARTVRYALERRAAQDTARELAASQALAAENTRLERGLLPVPITPAGVDVVAQSRPGRNRSLLGGDFYDVVGCPDGNLFAVIGDVCGHGPDEAALGVCLRVAWRTLVLAGTSEEKILPLMAELLGHERSRDEVFATVCMLGIDEDRRTARLYLAGHPAPILIGGTPVQHPAGAPIGVLDGEIWPAIPLELPPDWCLLLYTDGLIEGDDGSGRERLGVEGFSALIADLVTGGKPAKEWTANLIADVQRRNGGPLSDDVALLALGRRNGT